MNPKSFLAITIMVVGSMVASCGSSNPVAPLASFEPEIVNNQDSFQFQATALTQVRTSVVYAWENTGSQATIDHSSAITAGATLLQVFDDNGTEVYSDSLKASASDQTTVGIVGIWEVHVTLTDVDGTLNFRLETL